MRVPSSPPPEVLAAFGTHVFDVRESDDGTLVEDFHVFGMP